MFIASNTPEPISFAIAVARISIYLSKPVPERTDLEPSTLGEGVTPGLTIFLSLASVLMAARPPLPFKITWSRERHMTHASFLELRILSAEDGPCFITCLESKNSAGEVRSSPSEEIECHDPLHGPRPADLRPHRHESIPLAAPR